MAIMKMHKYDKEVHVQKANTSKTGRVLKRRIPWNNQEDVWCHELLWEYGGYMISLVCTNYENSENYQSLKISWDANAKTQINIPYVHANWFNMPKYMLGLD